MPNQCAALGACRDSDRSQSVGSTPPANSAGNSAIVTITTMIVMPIRNSGLVRR